MPLKNKLAKFVPGKLYKRDDFLFRTIVWQHHKKRDVHDKIWFTFEVFRKDSPILYLGQSSFSPDVGEFLIEGELWHSDIRLANDRPSFNEEEKHLFS